MKHIEHYTIDNKLINYNILSDNEKGKIRFRYYLINSFIKNSKNNILDIGSGQGFYSSMEKQIISIDISQDNNNTQNIKCEGDVYSLPFKNNSFDCIILSQILEHLEYPDKALIEIKRILNNNGYIIITVPNNEKIRKTLCIHCNKETPLNAHLHSFNKQILKEILYENGFIIEHMFLFENKILDMIKFYSLMKHIPFFIIKYIDSIAKILFNRYNKIIVICKRASSSVGRAHPSQG